MLSAADEFRHKTKRVHELWQTDFTCFKIIGWGWYYLSTVLDDFSRYIIAWLLTSTMAADDVKNTLEVYVTKAGVSGVKVRHRPRLLSDNESLDNLTPADVYYGRDKEITKARNLVKEQTVRRRRRLNMGLQPLNEKLTKPVLLRQCLLAKCPLSPKCSDDA